MSTDQSDDKAPPMNLDIYVSQPVRLNISNKSATPNPRPIDTSPSTSNGQHRREAIWISALFVLGIILSVLILSSPYDPDDEIPEYITANSYPYSFEVRKVDLYDKTNTFRVEVVMSSPTFSAQAPINVKIRGEQLNGTDVKEIHVLFIRAHNAGDRNTEYNPFIRMVVPVINRTFDSGFSETSIVYRVQGCYNIEVSSVHPPIRDYYKSDSCSEVRIDSLQATTQWQANRLNLENANLALKWTQIVFVYTAIGAGLVGYQIITHRRSSR
jgi:hypothetical protein